MALAAQQLGDDVAHVVNFTPFHWGGGFHYLPENYTFPSMTVKNIWDRWLHGVPCQGIPPYRHIVKDFKGISTSKEKVKFSKIRYVVEALLKHVNLSMSDILELGEAETNRLFLDAFQPYMVDNDKHRYSELSYITMYNRMKKANAAN